tara:strand:+ start:48 stop:500 length:453 start_codon:yes stop_codon:yes gene_type:complete
LNVVVNSEIPTGHSNDAIDIQKWKELAVETLQAEGINSGELNVIFVEAKRIQELNNTYLGKNEPTDVLAFPIDSQKSTTGETPTLLGDVVICPAKAKENASAQKKNHDEEIALLVLHGILHILGYDHAYPEEKAVMKNREQELLSKLYRS